MGEGLPRRFQEIQAIHPTYSESTKQKNQCQGPRMQCCSGLVSTFYWVHTEDARRLQSGTQQCSHESRTASGDIKVPQGNKDQISQVTS